MTWRRLDSSSEIDTVVARRSKPNEDDDLLEEDNALGCKEPAAALIVEPADRKSACSRN